MIVDRIKIYGKERAITDKKWRFLATHATQNFGIALY
jgi:hypothetical protein